MLMCLNCALENGKVWEDEDVFYAGFAPDCCDVSYTYNKVINIENEEL